ncbi:MAG: hypothetical protein ACHREM_01705 [Polyangiales bacterium]
MKRDGDVTRCLGVLDVTEVGDGRTEFRLTRRGGTETEHGELATTLSAAAREAVGSSDTAAPNAEPAKWSAIREALTGHGYDLADLPTGDITTRIQLDLRSGRVVATHEALHEYVDVDPSISRKMVSLVSGMYPKKAAELTVELERLLAANDTAAAVVAIGGSIGDHAIALGATPELLRVLLKVELAGLSPDHHDVVRNARILAASRLKDFAIVGTEAAAILAVAGPRLAAEHRASLRNAIAVGALHGGRPETAFAIWRELLAAPSDMSASTRAWIHRNMSLARPAHDPEARRSAKLSADAFLEAGDRANAASSLVRLANCLLHEDPATSIATLTEMEAWFAENEPAQRDSRASVLHARADRLGRLGRHAEAFADASEAARLRDGIFGVESARVSSFYLAALSAKSAGMLKESAAARAAGDALTEQTSDPHFTLVRRAEQLFTSFDRESANALIEQAEKSGAYEIACGVRAAVATHDPSLSSMERLDMLEDTLQRLKAHRASPGALVPAQLALALELSKSGDDARAITWYRTILAADPVDTTARQNLVSLLWKLGRWAEAAEYFKEQIRRLGDSPMLAYGYGRSLLEDGQATAALAWLNKAFLQSAPDAPLRRHAERFRQLALDASGDLAHAPPRPRVEAALAAVTRDEFVEALDRFALFIQREKRMRFWRSSHGKARTWAERPERLAQDLLHTFLKGSFAKRIAVFEEIACGAGRLDLYVVLEGGLGLIVELKMCGAQYPSSYAFEGEEQILHYMANKDRSLGYLLIFDGRSDTFGSGIEATTCSGPFTVCTRFIDLRPEVKPQAKRLRLERARKKKK